MKEKIICAICKKPMKETEWSWAEEDAHKECVLTTATGICSDDCGWFDMLEEGDECRECGAKLKPLTDKDRKRYRKMDY